MKIMARLGRAEDGQILYLTLIMLLLIAVFSLLLVNTVSLALVKIRAQNAADHLALSAATLKARVLNETVNLNVLLFGGVSRFGTASKEKPYATDAERFFGLGTMALVGVRSACLLQEYAGSIDDRLTRVARGNGLTEERTRSRLSHVDILLSDFDFKQELIATGTSGGVPSLMLTAIEPSHPWTVQSRVEWRTSKAVIGGDRLGVVLPDVVARARAEICDEGLPVSYGHDWRVHLVPPDESEDEWLRTR